MRPLGRNQQRVLDALRRYQTYHPGCGWILDNHSRTVKILDSLAARGLVTKHGGLKFEIYTMKG